MSSTYAVPNVGNRPPQLVDSGFYGDIRYDVDDSAPTYIGMNVETGADTSTNTDWKIIKFTYSGSNVTRVQTLYGAWSNRASLSW